MDTKRGISCALLTAAAVVLGLLFLRFRALSAPSVAFEFVTNRLTYLYVFAATPRSCFLIVG